MIDTLEKALNKYLQQKITLSIHGKVFKNGKLVLFSIKDFYLNFTFSIQNVKKIYEIPYPFYFSSKEGKIILDYTLSKFHHNIKEIIDYSRLVHPKKPTKFFDTRVEIAIEQDKL